MKDSVQRAIEHVHSLENAEHKISDKEALRRGTLAARMDAALSIPSQSKRNFDDDFDDYILQKSPE
ncbi:hypothetical protein [Brucella pseudogrignonensis]|uniref:Uncharacterized protein n=1 Tax=Brucella pseudogrignonensis TaxID=419475 RepID=A0ABU1MFJ6_9HYPH|nr:hypothetical protein [Brucella pseudogrignonensis]MDR6434637.1 hypothetical protein [Brucella pseudogrignonensis]